MTERDQQTGNILQFVADHDRCSCIEIAKGTGIERARVYRFLYSARCYTSLGGFNGPNTGKGWIENVKTGPDFTTPGEYQITEAGLRKLAQLERLRRSEERTDAEQPTQ